MSKRTQEIRAEIAKRGLVVIPHGKAWRITGRAVEFVTADLSLIRESDLQPAWNVDFSQRKEIE